MPPVDPFSLQALSSLGMGEKHFTITPSDSTDLTLRPRVLFCQAAGNVVIRDKDGTDMTYTLAQGALLPFRANRILATGTTATVIGWI